MPVRSHSKYLALTKCKMCPQSLYIHVLRITSRCAAINVHLAQQQNSIKLSYISYIHLYSLFHGELQSRPKEPALRWIYRCFQIATPQHILTYFKAQFVFLI